MIETLKPYAEYAPVTTRERHVEWLEALPDHWKTSPSQWLFTQRTERARPDDEQLSATQAYGVIPQKEYERRSGHKVVQIVQHLDKRAHVERDDFVISMRSFQGGLERAWSSGAIRSSYVVLKPSSQVDVGYYSYVFKCVDYISALQRTSNFIRDGQDLNFNNFRLVDLPVVPIEEQRAIAKFLDHANRRIQRYIRAKQKLIKLLEEQKQAIIHQAVTRGLDPNVRLKPSGVEWLGDVPEHWEVKRLKALFREVDVRTKTGTEVLLSLRMHDGLVPHTSVSEKPISSESLVGYKQVLPGQLVMNRMRAAIGIFGVPEQAGLVSPDYATFNALPGADAGYFLRLFKTAQLCDAFRLESRGLGTGSSGFMRLYTDRFGRIRVAVPPIEEQHRIVERVAEVGSVESAGIARLHSEVKVLREYLTRLIADVVTGKLDVREAAVRLPHETDEQELSDEGDSLDDAEDEETDDLNTEAEEVEE